MVGPGVLAGPCAPRGTGHPRQPPPRGAPRAARLSAGLPCRPSPPRCCPHSNLPSAPLRTGDVTSATAPGMSSPQPPPHLGRGAGVPLNPTFSFRRSRRPSPAGRSYRGVFHICGGCRALLVCQRPSREGAIFKPSLCKPRLSPGELMAAGPGSGAGRRKFCGVFLQGFPSPPEPAAGLDPPAAAAAPQEPKLGPTGGLHRASKGGPGAFYPSYSQGCGRTFCVQRSAMYGFTDFH